MQPEPLCIALTQQEPLRIALMQQEPLHRIHATGANMQCISALESSFAGQSHIQFSFLLYSCMYVIIQVNAFKSLFSKSYSRYHW